MVKRDQRVGLPAPVGQFELPHRLVALTIEPVRHVLDQLPQRVRRERQGEELRRILINPPRPRPLRHLVQVSRELRQAEFAGLQLLPPPDDITPRGGSAGLRQGLLLRDERGLRESEGYRRRRSVTPCHRIGVRRNNTDPPAWRNVRPADG